MKQWQWQWQWLIVSVLGMILMSCSLDFPQPNQAQPGINKKILIPNDMYLIESKQSSLLSGSLFWVFSLPEQPYYNNYVNATLPTLSMYQRDTQTWQRWQGNVLSTWARVVGIIRKGTIFHIIDVTPRGNYQKDYWVSIQLDNGEHRGQIAYYGNPKALIPDRYPAS